MKTITKQQLQEIYPFYIHECIPDIIELNKDNIKNIFVHIILGYWRGMPSKHIADWGGYHYKDTGNYISICKIANLCEQPIWKCYPAGYALENGWLGQ